MLNGKVWRGMTVCVVAAVLGFVAVPKVKRTPAPPPVRCVPSEGDALSGIGPDAGVSGGPIPATPEEWQRKPPCDAALGERALNNACYVGLLDRTPPCGPRLYEHAGACYRAVARTKAEPTSIQR